MSKISELSDGGVIQGGDTLIAVRSGGNVKVTYGGSTTANIDGGTIDNTVIGGTTPAAGNFTTVTADGLTVEGGDTVLSDTTPRLHFMESDTTNLNSRLRNQGGEFQIHSVDDSKATPKKRIIVDNATGDISFYEDTGTTAKLTWDASAETLNFADSGKAVFGAGSDLEIYHDGSHSYIKDAGTGRLKIIGNDQVRLENTDGDAYLAAVADGSTFLYYAGANKFATTSTGIDVTGTIVGDGLTVDGAGTFGALSSKIKVGLNGDSISSDADFYIQTSTADPLILRTNFAQRQRIDSNGDISFYEDTGTTAKLFWDASAESLGVGTTSPVADSGYSSVTLDGSTGSQLFLRGAGTDRGLVWASSNFNIEAKSTTPMVFRTNATERMRIDSSGLVSIKNNTASTLRLESTDTAIATNEVIGVIDFYSNDASGIGAASRGSISLIAEDAAGAGSMLFKTSNASTAATERMRIDASGNLRVGVGNTFEPTIQFTNSGRVEGNPGYSFNGDLDTGMFNPSTQGTIAFSNNGSESMRIDSSGNLLVGTTDTVIWNDTSGEGVVIGPNAIQVARASDTCLLLNRQSTDGILQVFASRGVQVGSVSVTTTATTYNTSSDQRLKDNIVDAPSASDDIDAIQVRSFDWKADGSHQKYGMVAQELQTVAPEAVTGDADSDDMMGVDYSKLVPMMLKEIQSLRARVAQLEGEN